VTRVALLASGRGTNAQALLDAMAAPDFPARCVAVVSNVEGAGVLARAEAAGVPALTVVSKGRTREAFEEALLAVVGPSGTHSADLVCLAGFMRVLTPRFLDAFAGRVLNIHPALLPAFPGAHGVRDALAYGVVQAGATVHLVDAGIDTGPILAQGTVPVHDDDDERTLAARILALEHRLYPMALRWMAEERVTVEGRRARVRLAPGESRWIAGI
jgi:phosphoribosylglycinamide formyltransferase-1